METDLRGAWNRLSEYYQRTRQIPTDSAHYGTFAPNEDQLRLLGDVSGKRVLELGSGGGQCSIALAKAGARCIAVDQSDAQIAFARRLAEQEGAEIEFCRADIRAFLARQPAEGYDILFSAFAFQYVDALPELFRECRRVLAPGGLFVFSLDHPFSDVTRWENGRVVVHESYFDRGRMDWDWELDPALAGTAGSTEQGALKLRIPFYSYHRTVSDMLNALADAGFVVERMLEPEPVGEEVDVSAEDCERFARLPATIIWKARNRR